MYTHLLVRGGELFLKGKNYGVFEQRLRNNISLLTGVELKKIKSLRGRFILPFTEDHYLLKRVFGIVSYSPAVHVKAEMEAILTCAVTLMREKNGTFKVETKRSDKRFPVQSPEISLRVGKFVEEQTSLQFQRENPDYLLQIEINHDGAYLFLEDIICFGGLPTGAEGPVWLSVKDKRSLLAGLFMMKRGISVLPVVIGIDRKIDISLLQKFSPLPLTLHVFQTLGDFKERALQLKIDVLVVGDTFDPIRPALDHFLILKPLIAFDGEQIQLSFNSFKSA